ncbi:hypothetical protein ACL2XP_10415 [Sodalis sp. RH21]|uniref:hypothetical protein n=1 Tax=Sodalis sp. RH21 TaxID=3394336 RepID=UPI0039B47496
MTNAIIYPVLEVNGTIKLPSSKPHMQRCLLLAFFNNHKTEITNVSWCSETSLLLKNLTTLGLKILNESEDRITLQGIIPEQITPNADVNAEGSGFVFRAMVAISALTETLVIRCNASLYSRDSVLDKDFLSYLGVNVTKSDSELKFTTTCVPMTSNKISTEKSSQFLSMAMMLANHMPQHEIMVNSINLGEGYITITEDMLSLFGYQCKKKDNVYFINKKGNSVVHVRNPTDFTSIGYIMSTLCVMKKPSMIKIENYVAGNRCLSKMLR